MQVRQSIAVTFLTTAIMAVPASPVRAETKQSTFAFELHAQDLGASLRAVGRLSGSEIVFQPETVAGRTAPPLRGTMTVADAIARLLRHSGLSAEVDGGSIVIRGRSQAAMTTDSSSPPADIVVTGTHIRGAPPSATLQTYSRAAIEDAGQSDLGTFVRTIPQNFSGGQNPGVAGGGNQGGDNQNSSSSSALNLRGLGPSATLTLLNGHRLAYDTVAQGVDISQIPLAAIDRIEIVTDGSSALYGSDAVGGVANVALRRDYSGLLASARIGGTTDGGGFQQQYSLLSGSRWASGGFMAAVDYTDTAAITAAQRSYTRNLDGSSTLVPAQQQISGVIAGHQRITPNLTIELDGQFNQRHSEIDAPTTTTADVRTSGLVSRPDVTSGTLSGTLRWDLGDAWTMSALGAYGISRNHIHSRRYVGGTQTLESYLNYDNSLATGEVSAEGRLISLPGGDVRLAVGGGYREVGLDVLIRQIAGGTSRISTNLDSDRTVWFGYGELAVPIVGAANRLPMIDQLQLSIAARHERYEGDSAVTTPKLGILYRPAPPITIRANWGKSFKAPTLYQEYQARQGILLPASVFRGSPNALPVLALAGGNPALQPERATSWTAGAEVVPTGGLRVAADYFDIRYRGRVVSPITSLLNAFSDPTYRDYVTLQPSAALVNTIVAGLPQGLSNQTGKAFDPAGVGAIVDASLQNAASAHLRGVDASLHYRTDLGTGSSLDVLANGTYLESDRRLASGFPLQSLAGTIFNPPHWRGRAGATWQEKNVTLSAFANYIGGTLDNRFAAPARVGSFKTLDLVMQIHQPSGDRPLSGTSLLVSVTNLFNEKPTVIRNTIATDPPYDSTNYPVNGRTVSVTISKAF